MNRQCMVQEFYIEEHAVLYALLHRAAVELFGEAGEKATVAGTILYAKERGGRMAKRAQRDGKELTARTYLTYGEWEDHLNWSSGNLVALGPTYNTQSTKCGWCDSWAKHDLLDYGKLYCTHIDLNLVKGFNPDNDLDLRSTLAHGADCCDFHWVGASFEDEADLKAMQQEKLDLREQNIKDFLYHTAHLYSAMMRAYEDAFGEEADKIKEQALREFEHKFSATKRAALEEESKLDFSAI